VQVYRDLVALSQRSLSTVQQTYELGRATLLDLLAEQRRHLDAERAYSGAMQAAYEAATALQLATGAVR
jgi:outer membrane protein TolC